MIEIAAILSAALDHWDDLAVIVLMLLVNAAVGFWQEYNADTAIEALKQRLTLFVRAYSFVSFLVVNAVKVATHGLLEQRMGSHARHLHRVEGPLAVAAGEVSRR